MADATLAQGDQLITLILHAKNPKGFIQNLISNWRAVQMIGRGDIDQATFLTAIEKVVNKYSKEETNPIWFYPKGWKPIGILEQLSVLKGFYPSLNGSRVVDMASRITIPEDVDGKFVFPKPSSVAAKLGISDPLGDGYGLMLEASVLVHLASQREFHNNRVGELTPDRVRMRQSAANAIRKLEAEQPEGDFLVLAAQTGQKWGGYSPQNALWEIENKSEFEFPLPSWFVGHIILTNPTRLDRPEILWVDCPGDEYRLKGVKGFKFCLYFSFDGGHLDLGSRFLDVVSDDCGSASGFSG